MGQNVQATIETLNECVHFGHSSSVTKLADEGRADAMCVAVT